MKLKINQKLDLLFFIALFVMILLLVVSSRAQTTEKLTLEALASAGTFTLEKSVIAGGGNQMQSATTQLSGTTGQSVAGHQSSGGNFTLYSGFWTPEDFTPTASTATVGGRVQTAKGKGIRKVKVTITFPSGKILQTTSGASGYYNFTEIPSGATYIISVNARRYIFSQTTQVRDILGDTTDVNFVADEVLLNKLDGEQNQ